MHTKMKGSIGELAVAKSLRQQNYYVFTELGDLSKTDLIIESEEGKLYKIQVKYASLSKRGTVDVSKKKSGPNYSFSYSTNDFDVLAVYCPELDSVAYVSSIELCSQTTIALRIEPALNKGGSSLIRYFSEYTNIKRALRDFTGKTQTDKAVGYEKVQTYNISNRTLKTSNGILKPNQYKIDWPEDSTLESMIRNCKSLESLSRELGVSSNAIRKHCRIRKINYGSRN